MLNRFRLAFVHHLPTTTAYIYTIYIHLYTVCINKISPPLHPGSDRCQLLSRPASPADGQSSHWSPSWGKASQHCLLRGMFEPGASVLNPQITVHEAEGCRVTVPDSLGGVPNWDRVIRLLLDEWWFARYDRTSSNWSWKRGRSFREMDSSAFAARLAGFSFSFFPLMTRS